jgi:hypothetical protein
MTKGAEFIKDAVQKWRIRLRDIGETIDECLEL